MTLTINTSLRKIFIEGSFHFSEFDEIYQSLPVTLKDFTIEVVPTIPVTITVSPQPDIYYIQQPTYFATRYFPPTLPFRPPFEITAGITN
jgi:hypothetical protein